MGAAGSVLDHEDEEGYPVKIRLVCNENESEKEPTMTMSYKSETLSDRHPFQSPVISRTNSTRIPTLHSTKPSSGTFMVSDVSPRLIDRFNAMGTRCSMDGLSEDEAFNMVKQKLENYLVEDDGCRSASSRNALADLIVLSSERID